MARVTVEDCLPLVDNRFALVLLATKRTRQLMAGARPLMPNTKNKAPVLSLREIATGKVRFDRAVPRRPLRQVRQGEGHPPRRADPDPPLASPSSAAGGRSPGRPAGALGVSEAAGALRRRAPR